MLPTLEPFKGGIIVESKARHSHLASRPSAYLPELSGDS